MQHYYLKCRRPPQSIWAHLGKVNRMSTSEGLVIQIYRYGSIKCSKKYICSLLSYFRKVEHHGYTSGKPSPLEYDVALLRLQHGIDLTYSHQINSVCWPTVEPPVGRQVVVSGWGIKFQQLGQYGKARLLQKVESLCSYSLQ